eukprot:scaffold315325_cov26-Tisochrysis_lutea.AAC.1
MRSSSMRGRRPGTGWRRSLAPTPRVNPRPDSSRASCRRRSVSRICRSMRSSCHSCEKDLSERPTSARCVYLLSSSRLDSCSSRTVALVTASSFCMFASSRRCTSAALNGVPAGEPGRADGDPHAVRGAPN